MLMSAVQELNKWLVNPSEFSQSRETERTAFWLDNENL